MSSPKPELLASVLRIGLLAMMAAVSACAGGGGGGGASNDGFINGMIKIVAGEYARREEALQSEIDRLAEQLAVLENEKQDLMIEDRRLSVDIDETQRELAALQRSVSALPRPTDPASGDAIAAVERKVGEIGRRVRDLRQYAMALAGRRASG